jgi:hypothetical protein
MLTGTWLSKVRVGRQETGRQETTVSEAPLPGHCRRDVRPGSRKASMNRNSMMEPAYSADSRLRDRPSSFDRQASEVSAELSRRTSVVVIILLSLGLWAALYAAVASLTEAALR